MSETTTPPRSQASDGEQPVGELVRQFSEQTSTLIRQEIRLARTELAEKGKHAGIGAGMFGAAGLLALFGAAFLLAAGAAALATAVDTWIALLIVAGALFAVAGILALAGRGQVAEATPPIFAEAVQSTHDDVDRVKEAAKR